KQGLVLYIATSWADQGLLDRGSCSEAKVTWHSEPKQWTNVGGLTCPWSGDLPTWYFLRFHEDARDVICHLPKPPRPERYGTGRRLRHRGVVHPPREGGASGPVTSPTWGG